MIAGFAVLGLSPVPTVRDFGIWSAFDLLLATGAVLALLPRAEVHAMAHVTGGGLPGNLPRVLPEGCRARISRTAWTPPPVFATLQHAGRVDETEMFRAFNMGIGYVIVLPPKDVDRATDVLRAAGETVLRLGEIVAGERGVELAA